MKNKSVKPMTRFFNLYLHEHDKLEAGNSWHESLKKARAAQSEHCIGTLRVVVKAKLM